MTVIYETECAVKVNRISSMPSLFSVCLWIRFSTSVWYSPVTHIFTYQNVPPRLGYQSCRPKHRDDPNITPLNYCVLNFVSCVKVKMICVTAL